MFQRDKEQSRAGLGLSKDKVGRMKNVEYAAAALSWDDELAHHPWRVATERARI